MRFAWLLVFVVAACPEPVEGTCVRALVDAAGNPPNGGFAGGTGGGPSGAFSPVGIEGEPVQLTAVAPLTSCVSDELRATLEVVGPDNLPLPREELPLTATTTSVVRADFSFTPQVAGTYQVRAVFEPSLGVRSQTLVVAAARAEDGGVSLALNPDGCIGGPWPLSEDTVVCERSGGTVSLVSADGGERSFSGEQVVVADQVLWSVARATRTLERRIFEDGGLRLADGFAGFTPRAVPGMHDERVAIRERTNGLVAAAHVAGPIDELGVLASGTDGTALFLSSQGGLIVAGGCSSTCFQSVRAVEPAVVWRDGAARVGVDGLARPVASLDEAPRFHLDFAAESFAAPVRGFERLPLWVPVPGSPVSVLVSADDGQLQLRAWTRADVLRVGRRFVLLRDRSLGGVRVLER
jgi:hypothetical protein